MIASALEGWSDEERETLRAQLHRLVETLLTQHDSPAPTDSQEITA